MTLIGCQSNEAKKESKQSFLIGTYTDGKSEGIYSYDMNTKTGEFSAAKLVANTSNPSFLTYSQDRNYVIAVNEDDVDGTGFVSSFKVEQDSLSFVNQVVSKGAHPCHVFTDENNNVFVSNYTGGNLTKFSLENGKLLETVQVYNHHGKGAHSRQEAPHVHSSWKIDEEIVAVDLGTNELWVYQNNKDSLKLKTTVVLEENAGPRHLVVHTNNKKWLYVLNELNSTVSLVKKNDDGLYNIVSTVSMLPDNYDQESYGADIKMSSDGNFLYASNRGHNSIVVYSVNKESGELAVIQHQSVKGNWPRNFAFSPNEEFLIVANQKSNNLVSFTRDRKTGMLQFVHEIEAPTPVCILF